MSPANTKLIVLDAVGQSVVTIDGKGNNRTVLTDGLDKVPDGVFVDAAGCHIFASSLTGELRRARLDGIEKF